MRLAPYPYRARARWGDVVVAQSDRCLSLESDDAPAELCFPPGDFDLALFRQDGEAPATLNEGKVRLWSIDGPDGGAALPDKEAWISRTTTRSDGEEVLRTFVDPPAALAPVTGYGAFDQERVRVEVIDRGPGDDERDVTLKRFPTWGDASHLIDILDVRHEGEAFVSVTHDNGRRPVVEGSQMLGQTIVAAGRHAPGPPGRLGRHGVHAAGRRPSAASIHARGAERGSASSRRSSPRSSRTASAAPAARCCSASPPRTSSVTAQGRRWCPGPMRASPSTWGSPDETCGSSRAATRTTSDAPAGPPNIDAWVRFRSVPDDPALHAGLLAQFTGHMSIAAALRPHEGIGQDQAHRTLSMGINAITLSLHRPVRADRWMLYHHLSTFAGDGMTHSECRVHDEEGELLASFTVEAMVRGFPGGGVLDDRTGL